MNHPPPDPPDPVAPRADAGSNAAMRESLALPDLDKPPRRLRVVHRTRYHYDRPIARSLHRLHLRPLADWKQRVISHHIAVTPAVPLIDYEDAFGNWATRCEIPGPYADLDIVAESVVDLFDYDPFAFTKLLGRMPTIPLAWMPGERTMLNPYLEHIELPDSQIRDLYDYAMFFAEKHHRNLMETLFAINLELFRNYTYQPNSTGLDTTPHEVMTRRRGVCQDFANLFISLARLLGVPARYVCGYVHTHIAAASRAGSDATHAWVQLYIPEIGWKGFDPTNGVLTQLDHVRVGYGRHYRDAAPITGTLFGQAVETMTVDVHVTDITQPGPPDSPDSTGERSA